MDLYFLLSLSSLVLSWLCSAVLSAPAAPTGTSPEPPGSSPEPPGSSPGPPITGPVPRSRRARTKRCSCSSFLDKECVYFCHLDIIWVNTPERVVSYGLGNAPRTRRALRDPTGATGGSGGGARCRCVRQDDAACNRLCGSEKKLRSEEPRHTGSRSQRRPAGTRSPPRGRPTRTPQSASL